jgi:dihydrofolate synthase/folylpolyglutamate synthase
LKTIDSLLAPFHQFGVNLGLARIEKLLATLGNPQSRVPIIHVAGTNGKGSVCAYVASVLTAAGYRVGKYTSPHLIDWRERISIDGVPIPTPKAIEILERVIDAIDLTQPIPTQFEIVTAAAWVYFAEAGVDIGVFEVGLGGRLDATNVCAAPLVTAIVSISREHWQQLGNTVAEIATQKAGIIKPQRPVVMGVLPPDAAAVVTQRSIELNAPLVEVTPAIDLGDGRARYGETIYPLPLLGEIQLLNSAVAIEIIHSLQSQGWNIDDRALSTGMSQTRWRGRIEWMAWQGEELLIDGAHNPAAALALRNYVDTLHRPMAWVMGMLSTKEHPAIFRALLRDGDRLDLLPVPGHSTAEPQELATIARSICPQLQIDLHTDVDSALTHAFKYRSSHQPVLCGSLYLLGDFLARQDPQQDHPSN